MPREENADPVAATDGSPPDGAAGAADEAARRGDQERREITGRAGIVAAGTLASRALGLVRDQVLAGVFSRAATDAFFVAFLLPNVLRQLLAEGAVQTAVLPVLSQTRERSGEAEAKRAFRALRGLSLIALSVVSVLGVLAAPLLVDLFAGGFRQHEGQYERTVSLARWVFPYIFFMGTAALGVAALNTHRRFVATSFAPALLNIAFIVCALALPGWLGARGTDQIFAMAFGVLIGGALQVVAQWPSLKKIGYLSLPSFELRHPAVREALRRMGPVLIGVGVYYVDVILARRFLSELDVGSQSYFAYALRLCDFPQGIFVMALQTATLPSLSALFARGELGEVAKTFSYGMRLSLFVGFAATLGVVFLAEPIVVMIFQRGQFDAEAARETGRSLAALGLHIWLVAAVRQLVAVYYAMGDTRTPVVVAALDLAAFVALALALRGPLGHVGVSLAVSGASLVQMLLLWAWLGRRLPGIDHLGVMRSGARSLLASLLAGLGAWLLVAQLAGLTSQGALARLVPGLVGCVSFVVLFLVAARLLKSEELSAIGGPLIRRLRRRG
ncbi:MAG: murein biosynthesis integral membrane protein MurJ [Polyangiaceae bacterium]|nr:murein biosynthesis integral membrane protein MurJ [Polyangiaceae bacterium]MCW5790921.1 murein biosynthesis integral membrane protein MurJ [Polyangiaceae bacterium]